MAHMIGSAAVSAASGRIGGSFEAFPIKGNSAGKPSDAGAVRSMGHALPQLSVRASGPGCDIRWEEYNYPPLVRLIHFDITELQLKLRKTVRLLNMSFLLTTFTCLLNVVDTAIFVFAGAAPFQWLIQSLLHVLLLPPAALGVFYLGYRGLAAPEPLLAHRFQYAQLALGFVSVLLATFPYKCVNGLIRLAFLSTEGMEGFQAIVTLVESGLWMLNACLAVVNWAQVRHNNTFPDSNTVYGPQAAKATP